MALTATTRDTFQDDVLRADVAVCVFYNAPWCRAGREMAEVVQAAAEEVGDKMRFFTVNTDEESAIAGQQGVRTVPTVHFLSRGKKVDEVRGAVSRLDLLGRASASLAGEAD